MSEPRTTRPPEPATTRASAARSFTCIAFAGGSAGRWFTRSTRAEGADASGLASLIDLHAIQSAGDALLTVALANTLFFSVAVDQARSRVALYLLVTMAPFAVIAPVIGPLLDRFRNGRRYALADNADPACLPGLGDGRRGRLAWRLRAVSRSVRRARLLEGVRGVAQRGRATRAAAERHLGPRQRAVDLVGRAHRDRRGTDRSGPELGDRHAVMDPAALRGRLPRRQRVRVQAARASRFERGRSPPTSPAAADESAASIRRWHAAGRGAPVDVPPRILPPLRGIGPRMTTMLRASAGLRRIHRLLDAVPRVLDPEAPARRLRPPPTSASSSLAPRLGSVLGTTLGGWLKPRQPEILAIISLFSAAIIGVVAAIWFNLGTAALAILVANISQSLSKLGLDSVIQRDAVEHVRTSAFARSETVLQLSWVLGGFVAILLPSNGSLGLTLGSAVLLVVLFSTVKAVRTRVSPDRGIELLRERRRPAPSDA